MGNTSTICIQKYLCSDLSDDLPPSRRPTKDLEAEVWANEAEHLAFVTSELPGVGGTVRRSCEHFAISEHLGVTPENTGGRFWWFRCARRDMSTHDAVKHICARLGVDMTDVGTASIFPSKVFVTQWFSVPKLSARLDRNLTATDFAKRLQPELYDISDVKRASMPIGAIAAFTRFEIVISGDFDDDDALAARNIADRLSDRGVPNYCDVNITKALWGRGHVLRLANSADADNILTDCAKCAVDMFSSLVFNVWLSRRIKRHHFETRIEGDVCVDVDYTGPLLGRAPARLPREGTVARRFEDELAPYDWPVVCEGASRRVGCVQVRGLCISHHVDGLVVDFVLPAGSCPSAVIREIIKDNSKSSGRTISKAASAPNISLARHMSRVYRSVVRGIQRDLATASSKVSPTEPRVEQKQDEEEKVQRIASILRRSPSGASRPCLGSATASILNMMRLAASRQGRTGDHARHITKRRRPIFRHPI